MKGIINVLKPPGMTSHDIIGFLRKLFNIKKIGHGGTLDPPAAGVLPVFVGKATKAVELFENDYKEYVAELSLGVTTDTGDMMGKVIYSREHPKLSEKDINSIFKQFIGKTEQIPPMYSAVRHKGKKLYELARKGITVERKPRTIEIKSIKLIKHNGNKFLFKVLCSKGTYIRTLCEDIGNKIGCGGHLSCLIRTRSGLFDIRKSHTLEEIESSFLNNSMGKILISIGDALSSLPKLEMNLQDNKRLYRGSILHLDRLSHELINQRIRIYNNNIFVGVASVEIDNSSPYIRILKTFI